MIRKLKIVLRQNCVKKDLSVQCCKQNNLIALRSLHGIPTMHKPFWTIYFSSIPLKIRLNASNCYKCDMSDNFAGCDTNSIQKININYIVDYFNTIWICCIRQN